MGLLWLAASPGCLFSLDESLWRTAGDASPPDNSQTADRPATIDGQQPVAEQRPDVAPSETADDLRPTGCNPPCTEPEVCVDGACVCADQCEEGSTRCATSTAMQLCIMTASGCTAWDLPIPCSSTETCSEDRCVPVCSATGVDSVCDPIGLTGCPAGSCYVTASGTRCVCPEGALGEGEDCPYTRACSPGHVCAGTVAPGTCRMICDPDAPQCPAGWSCIHIAVLPAHGYCEPP